MLSRTPNWWPFEGQSWVKALHALGPEVRDASRASQSYALPPPHLFATDVEVVKRYLLVWLRIRQWALQQAFFPNAHCMILMTAEQWRWVLFGKYYYLDSLDYISDTSRLQVPLSELKSLQRDPEPFVPPKKKHASVSNNLVVRSTVVHRMAYVAGFPPYNEHDVSRCLWRGRQVTRNDIASNNQMRCDVVRELSILIFRLELFALDRIICTPIYDSNDATYISARQLQLMSVWGTGGLIDVASDDLTSEEWQRRSRAVKNLEAIMVSWGFKAYRHPPTQSGMQYNKYEEDIFRYYILTFYSYHGRIPIFPMSARRVRA